MSFSYSYRLTVLWGADGNWASAGVNVTAPIQRWRSRNGVREIAGRDREDAAIASALRLQAGRVMRRREG